MYSSPRRRETSIDNGLIYPFIYKVIKVLYYLNVVELIKKITEFITVKYYKNRSEVTQKVKIRRNRNIAIDLFILLKFLFIVIIIYIDTSSIVVQIAVWYLLISNVFTYFYYHLWCDDVILERFQTIHRARRRFVSFIISFIFMMLCYSYFYLIMTPEHFSLINKESSRIAASIISAIGNAFNMDMGYLKKESDISKIVALSQTINVFLFLTLLLTSSLPKAKQE